MARKVVSLIVFPCVVFFFGLALQGCDPRYLNEPVGDVEEVVPYPETSITNITIDYDGLARDCDAQALKDALTKITEAYRRKADDDNPLKSQQRSSTNLKPPRARLNGSTTLETIYEETVLLDSTVVVPPAAKAAEARSRCSQPTDQFLCRIFPEDPFNYFVTGVASGYLNKERVFCHILRYFPELSDEDASRMMLDSVQTAISRIIQHIGHRQSQWTAAKNDTKTLEAVRRAYQIDGLSDEQFFQLRDAVLPVEEEYIRLVTQSIETFARDAAGRAGCLQKFFEDGQQERCFTASGDS